MISTVTVAEGERGVVNGLDNHPSLPVLATSVVVSIATVLYRELFTFKQCTSLISAPLFFYAQ
jgi:hypothetical protein